MKLDVAIYRRTLVQEKLRAYLRQSTNNRNKNVSYNTSCLKDLPISTGCWMSIGVEHYIVAKIGKTFVTFYSGNWQVVTHINQTINIVKP